MRHVQLAFNQNALCEALVTIGIPFCLQELFPANKQSYDHFVKYFTEAGLKELADFVRNQQSLGARKELQKELQDQMARGDPLKEVILNLKLISCRTFLKIICFNWYI